MSFLQQEEVHDAFVLLHGYVPALDAAHRKEATALVTIIGLCQSVFGYPNEEAFWLDPRAEELGHGFYELQGSRWRENLNEYNKRTSGPRPGNSDWHLGGKFENARHFFIGSKGVSAQVLAEGLRVELFTDRPYTAVRAGALWRLDHWYEWHTEQGRPLAEGVELTRLYPDGIG